MSRFLAVLACAASLGCTNALGVPWTDAPTADRSLTPSTPNPGPQQVAWWSPDWGCRVPISLEGTVTEGDFPIRVELAEPAIDYGNFGPLGQDLRFIASDAVTELAFDVENWNPNGVTRVWIRWPSPGTPNDRLIHMYCGNPSAAASPDPLGVWSGFVGVWHLDDDLVAGSVDDSSSEQNTGTAFGAMDPGNVVAGQVETALDFDGLDDGVDFGIPASLTDFSQGLTLTAWVNPDTTSSNFPTIVDKDYAAAFSMYLGPNNELAADVVTSAGSISAQTNDTIANGQWSFVALTYDNTTLRLYIDGIERDSVSGGAPIVSQPSIPVLIGSGWEGSLLDYFFDGALDEVRVEAIGRSAEIVEAHYRSGRNDALSFGILELAP